YFYDYKNRDVEAGIAIDDVCYYFDTEDHTEEEMKEMAASLEEIDKPVQTISFDDVLFPTKFPSEKPQATNPRVIVHSNGDKIDFLMDYHSDRKERADSDLLMEFEVRANEPSGMSNPDEENVVDIDGFDEAYFFEDYMKLFLYNGSHYYIIQLDIDNDMLQAFGSDHIRQTFIDIGNSLQ